MASKAGRKESRSYVRWSAALGARICERVAAGELIYQMAREDPAMPVPETLALWSRTRPKFGAALLAARQAAGRTGRGPVSTYCVETATEICERLCEGESFSKIGADPAMPSLSTIFNWRRGFPDFEAAVQLAKAIQAERFCDEACALAEAATPETAYLTHVRLTHLRWATSVMAPRVYRLKAVDPPAPRETMTVLVRHFEVEVDEASGQRKVVAWCPNPYSGEAEREDAPGYRPPPGTIAMPGGRMG